MEFIILFALPVLFFIGFSLIFKDLRDVFEKSQSKHHIINDMFKQDDYTTALHYLTEKLKSEPKNPYLLYKMGETHYKLGNLYQTHLFLNKCIVYDNSKGQVFFLLAKVNYELGYHIQSLIEIEKAIAFGYKNSEAHYYKGLCLLQLNQYRKALKCFEMATKKGNEKANIELIRLKAKVKP